MANLQTLLLLEEEANRLENHFTKTGEKRFLLAARRLAPKTKRGRPPENDDPLLFRMALLLRDRKCPTRWAAAVRVATEVGGRSTEATASRLDRKFKSNGKYYRSNLSIYELRLTFEHAQLALKPLHDEFERIKSRPGYQRFMEMQARMTAEVKRSPLFEILQTSRRAKDANLLASRVPQNDSN